MINNVKIKVGKDICSGCGACSERCPKACIQMQEVGNAGFVYPVVNEDICLDCGACVKACPVLQNAPKYANIKVLAARTKDFSVLKSSNSGGVFSMLAKDFLKHGGYVCGAAFASDLSVRHQIISEIDNLKELQGSKYVQSEAYPCFDKIKQLLKDGKRVLFCGTGCQVAGLQNVLIKPYENLLTVELVCHGVPSPLLFKKYLKWLGDKKKGVVTSYRFRSKRLRPTGEHSQFFYTVNGKEYVGQSYEDPYYSSFLKGRTLRESCYNCHFKGSTRIADITLGDFWGLEKTHPHFPIFNGVNLVLINGEKGVCAFDKIKDQLVFEEATFEEGAKVNPSLIVSTKKRLGCIDYKSPYLFDRELKPVVSFRDRIKNRIPWRLKWWIKIHRLSFGF